MVVGVEENEEEEYKRIFQVFVSILFAFFLCSGKLLDLNVYFSWKEDFQVLQEEFVNCRDLNLNLEFPLHEFHFKFPITIIITQISY